MQYMRMTGRNKKEELPYHLHIYNCIIFSIVHIIAECQVLSRFPPRQDPLGNNPRYPLARVHV